MFEYERQFRRYQCLFAFDFIMGSRHCRCIKARLKTQNIRIKFLVFNKIVYRQLMTPLPSHGRVSASTVLSVAFNSYVATASIEVKIFINIEADCNSFIGCIYSEQQNTNTQQDEEHFHFFKSCIHRVNDAVLVFFSYSVNVIRNTCFLGWSELNSTRILKEKIALERRTHR